MVTLCDIDHRSILKRDASMEVGDTFIVSRLKHSCRSDLGTCHNSFFFPEWEAPCNGNMCIRLDRDTEAMFADGKCSETEGASPEERHRANEDDRRVAERCSVADEHIRHGGNKHQEYRREGPKIRGNIVAKDHDYPDPQSLPHMKLPEIPLLRLVSLLS